MDVRITAKGEKISGRFKDRILQKLDTLTRYSNRLNFVDVIIEKIKGQDRVSFKMGLSHHPFAVVHADGPTANSAFQMALHKAGGRLRKMQ